jgi:hypothetical protein
MNNIYSEITNDILKLYCSIKEPKLESLFIRLASLENFSNWVSRNGKIKTELNIPSVYDAFVALSDLRATFQFGQKIDRQTVWKIIQPNKSVIPIILGLNELVDVDIVKDIIQQYRDIIKEISEYMSMPLPNKDELYEDVLKIRNTYYKEVIDEDIGEIKKESIPQQRKNMFQYLLIRFSEDVASAADNSGLKDLANGIRSGILSKPVPAGLSRYLNFNNVDKSQIDIAKKLAEYIIKRYDPKFSDINHSIVETTIMGKAGVLTSEDIMQLKMKYEEQNNPTQYIEDSTAKYPGMDTSSKITFDKRLNPEYLLILSSFFVILQAKIGLPSTIGF